MPLVHLGQLFPRTATILNQEIPVWRIVWISSILAAVCASSLALATDRTIAQFAHTAWGAKEGAPGDIGALAQTSDGYLWLGTRDGLYRFDGIIFERYEPQSGGPFARRGVSKLLALPNGDLWIGFQNGGISLLRNGQLTTYAAREGVPNALVRGLAQDQDGTIWAATSSGLIRLEKDRWKEVGRDWNFQWQLPRAIFVDRQGTLWVSTGDTLVFLPKGTRRFQSTGIQVGLVAQIGQASNGKLWIAETSRSVRALPLPDGRQPLGNTEVLVGSQSILFDNDGALWITSLGDGLRRSLSPGLLKGKIAEFSAAVDSFTSEDGLSNDVALAILQDREGNVWVGTRNGLDRFRKTGLTPVLPHLEGSYAFVAGDAGDVWVVNKGKAIRFRQGQAPITESFPAKYNAVQYAYRDPAGAIWWVSVDAIYRYQAGSYSRLAFPSLFPKSYFESGIVVIEDGSGTMWLSAEREGLFFLKNGAWRQPEAKSDFTRLSASAAFTDWMGRAWIGYENSAIILLKSDSIQKVFLPGDSPVGGIRAIGGRGHHTWIGGELGLAFFDGERFRRVIPSDDETFHSVTGVQEVPDGGLWLAEGRGVIEIPASEAKKALDDSSHRVKYRLFEPLDGLPGRLRERGALSWGEQGTDGILWFASESGGIARVDPGDIFTNALPPPVSIRSVRANGRRQNSLTNLVLPPQVANLQIEYTALTLSLPERARFRYRLEGMDKDWQDAGIRREAFYTTLGPGHYRFQVIACNNDGVWNSIGAFLDFSVTPAWFQTSWFRSACVGAFLVLLWGLYRLRVHQLRGQFNARLEARVNERTRIARELHDTLLQSLHGLMFEFQAARNMFHKRPGEALQALDSAIMGTEQAISESQDAIENLRNSATHEGDLAELIEMIGEELVASRGSGDGPPTFGLTVEGQQRVLTPLIRDEAYRIAHEVLRNAFRHAQARRIETEILYGEDELRLRVRDDGKGMDRHVLEQGGRPGHWGLPGVRERAQRIGAKLDVWSEAGVGTEVQLTVPASEAYENTSKRPGFRIFRRVDNHEHRS